MPNVDPKLCCKSFKGVSVARLIDISPVQPALTFNRNDHRFVEGKDIRMDSGTNLASMDWEDFKHLVRKLFELEFAKNGGEVRVTQASHDGGVDAVVFDPATLKEGKKSFRPNVIPTLLGYLPSVTSMAPSSMREPIPVS